MGEWHEKVGSTWDKQANSWNERSAHMWEAGSRKHFIPFMKKHISEGSSIIDVGCGSGYSSYKLQASGYDVMGIDLSEEMIKLAEENFSEKGIAFKQCDLNHLASLNRQFDAALAINVLEWVENPAESLRAVYDALNKDGMFCVGILGPTAGPRNVAYRRLYGENVIINTMMPWEFAKLAEELDFTIVDQFAIHKEDVKSEQAQQLPLQLQQAISFMWAFMLKKS